MGLKGATNLECFFFLKLKFLNMFYHCTLLQIQVGYKNTQVYVKDVKNNQCFCIVTLMEEHTLLVVLNHYLFPSTKS